MQRSIQPLLLEEEKIPREFGGSLVQGKRKKRRPITTKKPMLFTMRSSYAIGERSFRRPIFRKFIEQTIVSLSKKFRIKVYESSINGNHLHLLIRGYDRDGLRNFFRVLLGLIARKVTGSERGKPFGKRFWDELAHSRIIGWRRHFKIAVNYVIQNRLEAAGIIPYTPRKFRPLKF